MVDVGSCMDCIDLVARLGRRIWLVVLLRVWSSTLERISSLWFCWWRSKVYTWFLLISIRGWRAELGCGGLELRAWNRRVWEN